MTTLTASTLLGSVTGGTYSGNVIATAGTVTSLTSSTGTITNLTTTLAGDFTITGGTGTIGTETTNRLVPVGSVVAFAVNSPPTGWLGADGSAVNRTTYAGLFSTIGTTHGTGDGSTTFNIPDLRGIFVRGSGSQTIDGTTYNKTFAAKERDAIQQHKHASAAAASGSQILAGGVNGAALSGSETGNMSTGRSDSNETRPANIALLYCIKF